MGRTSVARSTFKSSHNSTVRPAFTLVELMVVFGIICLLLSVLAITALRFRESGNRAFCQNNLRQMGLAFLAHDNVHGAFPSGGTYWYDTLRVWKDNSNNTVPAIYDAQSWGWGYQILPYLGKSDIWSNPDDTVVGDNPIVFYNCPSARPFVRFWYAQAGGHCYRYMWDYSGNGGSWGDWPNITATGNALDGPIVPSKNRSGRFVTPTNIPDGAGNLMLIGEKYLDANARLLQPICSDDQGWVDGWDNDSVAFCRGTSGGNAPVPPKQFDNRVGCGFFFGSSHLAMQCVFADGSTHSIQYAIDLTTWAALCSGTDGTPSNYSGVD